MERRVIGNYHARCGAGEKMEITSKSHLSPFLTNMTAIEYIRNASKRVRKKDSAIILASQNIEDCAKRCA